MNKTQIRIFLYNIPNWIEPLIKREPLYTNLISRLTYLNNFKILIK